MRGRHLDPTTRRRRRIIASVLTVALIAGGVVVGSADTTVTADIDTPATEIHGLPGNNPSTGGASANPAGQGQGGGNGIHNIQGGAPGWDGTSAASGGEPPACDMHGGLDDDDDSYEIAPCD